MTSVDSFRVGGLIPFALVLLGIAFAWRGAGLLCRLWRSREHRDSAFWLIRGARDLIVAISCACVSAGLYASSRGLLWFGIAFLLEELYETGLVLLILKWDRKKISHSPLAWRHP